MPLRSIRQLLQIGNNPNRLDVVDAVPSVLHRDASSNREALVGIRTRRRREPKGPSTSGRVLRVSASRRGACRPRTEPRSSAGASER